MRALNVYCAGDIAANDWRHDVAPGLSAHSDMAPADRMEFLETVTAGLGYTGPFFESCQHVGGHFDEAEGESGEHGCGSYASDRAGTRARVLKENLRRIAEADMVFCHIGKRDAFGTFAEIGYAHALRIPVFLSHHPRVLERDDQWFAAGMCSAAIVATPHEAWGLLHERAHSLRWAEHNGELHEAVERLAEDFADLSPMRRHRLVRELFGDRPASRVARLTAA